MSKLSKIKTALAKLIAENFASFTTDKGVIVADADELAVDVEVFVEDEEGNRTPAEDGEYVLDDERTIVVADGKIAEIREPKEPAAPEDEEHAEEPVAAEEEPEVENPTNEGEESDTEAIVKLRKEVNELYQIVDVLVKRVEALEGKPAAEPAAEEFEKIKFTNTSDKQVKAISRLFN